MKKRDCSPSGEAAGFIARHKKTSRLLAMTLIAFCFFAVELSYADSENPRYISLAPSTTEILFALGLDKEIVGVSSYCNYPDAAKTKPSIGDFSHPNIETIFSLKPDYIFSTGLEQAPVIEQLKQLNFRVYVADPSTIEELFTTIKDIGNITARPRQAEELIKKMKADIEEVTSKTRLTAQDKKQKVFIEIWHDPLMTAGKGSFVDELITMAGAINIAHDVKRPYISFSAEKVVNLNPDCIIMTYMDKRQPLELAVNRFGWARINAVRNKRVFNDISADIMLRPGPRITQGLKEIYSKLYPKE